jgi:hypothetical protein
MTPFSSVRKCVGLIAGMTSAMIQMGKRMDDEWNMRVGPPFSLYQAFGMAVCAVGYS